MGLYQTIDYIYSYHYIHINISINDVYFIYIADHKSK